MMSLKDLFLSSGAAASFDILGHEPVLGISCDSKSVEPGFVFVAVKGAKYDGHAFIKEAIQRGALCIVAEETTALQSKIPLVHVESSRKALAQLASAFYEHPSRALQVIGITGTNGKTTTSYLLEHLLQSFGQKTGVLGTVNYRLGDWIKPATQTTPGSLQIQEILSLMKKRGASHVVMEVSSHALDQHRVTSIQFNAALFTNLTQDHLDYHGSMENYFEAKARLFSSLSENQYALLNADDPWAKAFGLKTKAKAITYGIEKSADIEARDIECKRTGTEFLLKSDEGATPVFVPMIGRHNIYNVLGAFAAMKALGYNLSRCAQRISNFQGVPGRLEAVEAGQEFSVFVDFAHTPDGLENVLRSLQPYKTGKIITVFGCGGDRDKGKRPKMGKIASQLSDFIFITADNPRSEDPKIIADEIQTGFPKEFKNFSLIVDRSKAIRQALLNARKDDIVLLAGKGHESTQVYSEKTIAFSDREEALRVLRGN